MITFIMKKKNILKRRITKEKKEKRDNLDGNKKQLKKRTAKEKKESVIT